MLTHGYIVSNLARNERYNEAERLLDRVLKGYQKSNSTFEEDGSRTQNYTNTDGFGTHEVVLKKNVTDGHIVVYSNRPIKIMRFATLLFYVRDIIPTLIFAAFYILVGIKFNRTFMWTREPSKMLFTVIGGSGFATLVNFLTEGFLKHDRSSERIRFIQAGGLFCFLHIFINMLDMSGKTTIWNYWIVIISKTPFIESVGGIALTHFINRFLRGK